MIRRCSPARAILAVLLACLAAAVLPSAAGAARIGWILEDPAGDAPDPQLDLRKAVIALDEGTGDLLGSVTLGAGPTHERVDSVIFSLGRWSVRRDATCDFTHDITVVPPTPEDVEAGFPWPFAQLYAGSSDEPIGFLPTYTPGATIEFNTVEANGAVRDAVRAGAFTCGDVQAAEADTFETRDAIAVHPLVAGSQPACKIASTRVRPGRALRVRCAHASGDVTLRIYRPGRSGHFRTVRSHLAGTAGSPSRPAGCAVRIASRCGRATS